MRGLRIAEPGVMSAFRGEVHGVIGGACKMWRSEWESMGTGSKHHLHLQQILG